MPHAQFIARNGEINARDNPELVTAVKASGKKVNYYRYNHQRLYGIPGYQVFAVTDASGTYIKMAQDVVNNNEVLDSQR